MAAATCKHNASACSPSLAKTVLLQSVPTIAPTTDFAMKSESAFARNRLLARIVRTAFVRWDARTTVLATTRPASARAITRGCLPPATPRLVRTIARAMGRAMSSPVLALAMQRRMALTVDCCIRLVPRTARVTASAIESPVFASVIRFTLARIVPFANALEIVPVMEFATPRLESAFAMQRSILRIVLRSIVQAIVLVTELAMPPPVFASAIVIGTTWLVTPKSVPATAPVTVPVTRRAENVLVMQSG